MKHYLVLVALLLAGLAASAQNNGNQGSFVVSEAIIDDQPGTIDDIVIRLSGPAANEVEILLGDPTYSSRISTISFTKESGSTQGNASTSLWRASIDVESISDPITGDVEIAFTPGCCNIPQGGIVVRMKPGNRPRPR